MYYTSTYICVYLFRIRREVFKAHGERVDQNDGHHDVFKLRRARRDQTKLTKPVRVAQFAHLFL